MKKNKIYGWVFLDKPIGISSNAVLQKVRKIFGYCKAGYVGTLDPLASGFLPIALGDATKTKEVFRNGWYYTGDTAKKDADGYIWFVGRSDDIISSAG